jgi:hypothetical protein
VSWAERDAAEIRIQATETTERLMQVGLGVTCIQYAKPCRIVDP